MKDFEFLTIINDVNDANIDGKDDHYCSSNNNTDDCRGQIIVPNDLIEIIYLNIRLKIQPLNTMLQI